MKEIKRLRGRIDKIDSKMVRLLEDRVSTAKQIGALKGLNDMDYHDPQRERDVLENVSRNTVLKKKFVKKIFRDVMDYCRDGESG